MTNHTLTLHYHGRRASHGALLPSASKQVIAGAQVLLAAHGYYFTQGLVPDRLLDRSDYFEINDLARTGDGWSATFGIDVASDEHSDCKKFGFSAFVAASYRAWSEKRLCEDPPYDRRQPLLTANSRATNSAVFDTDVPSLTVRRRLYARTSDALALITAPLGASANALELYWDGKLIDTKSKRLVSDVEIEDALIAMRLREPHTVRSSH